MYGLFCLFPGRLVSCCKKWNHAFIAPSVISYTHSHKPKSLLLARKFFYNFPLLHNDMADSPRDNENANKFPC